MKQINFKKEVKTTLDKALVRIEELLKENGFGILTRIDFDKKMKEKLNKDLHPIVILGACHPQMAYEAFQKNKNFTSILPCNVVLRELEGQKISIEIAKPSAMIEILGDQELSDLAKKADELLAQVLEKF